MFEPRETLDIIAKLIQHKMNQSINGDFNGA